MHSCLFLRLQHLALAAVFIGGTAIPFSVSAVDASLPYRKYPGFQCHQWNRLGECSDWSYFEPSFNAKTPPPAYGAAILNRPVNPTYRCQNPTVDCTGSVSVRGSASPGVASRGEILTYNIYLRNDDSQNRTVSVRAYMDGNVGFVNATYGGYSDGTMVRWDNQSIPARMSRTMILRVRVRGDASTGKPIVLRIQSDRSSDSVSTNVMESTYYNSNAIRFTDDGVYVRSGHPPRYIRTDFYNSQTKYYPPEYYYSRTSNNYYRNSYSSSYGYSRSYQGGFYCDSRKFVCRQ
ncbi:DUF11 domain-containing protein [Candidatus Peribacteria bacterium]|nr:DUF11 domain-containing protein [Candidatus Peribacteria bacterium]